MSARAAACSRGKPPGPPASPKLSICLLTYNRSKYLSKALESVFGEQHFDFDFEVLISDNASIDDTESVVSGFMERYPQIRYLRQASNVGAEANLVAAYREATGEYTMYLADDDLVIPKHVAKVVRYLDNHPNVAVCYAPWELWDDVTKAVVGNFYTVDKTIEFSKNTAGDLCNYIVQHHIFPEIAIYRAEALRQIVYRQHKIYWAFANLINVLEYGDVAFLSTVFYRSVTRHWVGETRGQHGYQQVVSDWDLYRGGIEYMIHRAFNYGGVSAVPPDQRSLVLQMVQSFINIRMKVALNILIGLQRFVDAHDVFARLLANDGLTVEEATSYRSQVSVPAALQAFLETFRSITRASLVGMYGNSDTSAVRRLFAALDPSVPLVALGQSDLLKIADKESYLVLAGDRDRRAELLASGFPPGQVWAEQDLLRQFSV